MSASEAERTESGLGRAIRLIESGVLAVLFLALLVLGLTQIGLRNLAGTTLLWADEAMRALVLWLAMAGGVAAAGRLRHIRIDLVENWLPEAALVWLRRTVFALTAAVCVAMTWYGLHVVALEYEFEAVAFSGVPVWVVQLAIPLGFGIMAARFGARALLPPVRTLPPHESAGPDP